MSRFRFAEEAGCNDQGSRHLEVGYPEVRAPDRLLELMDEDRSVYEEREPGSEAAPLEGLDCETSRW